jgi:hypothetical protein
MRVCGIRGQGLAFVVDSLTKEYLPPELASQLRTKLLVLKKTSAPVADSHVNFRPSTAHVGKAGGDARHGIVWMNFVFQIDETFIVYGD